MSDKLTIRFDDGAAYDRSMGVWSRFAGEAFLDWLAPPPGLRWADVGCGSGAFSELLLRRCAPAAIHGVDPSEGQIAHARAMLADKRATFETGDAMALPMADAAFDAAVMALVIFFVPEPAKGLAEMVRVTRPGGIVCAYAWNLLDGGSPFDPLRQEAMAMGQKVAQAPSMEASGAEALTALWTAAGLRDVATHPIEVRRTYADFDEWWDTTSKAASFPRLLAKLSPAQIEELRARMRARLPADAEGRITYPAHATAVRGTVPG
ncbi:MAG: methyltransferase domain-containing protein [Proteobacteria bacterium]|nr:methyltransferase domain-containing protein [Pseudomonadota bacterium]